MNKKGYYRDYNFSQALLTAGIVIGFFLICNAFGIFNQGQIVEVPQNPVDAVTELQRNYDNLLVINQELGELVDWDFYAENQELQKKLDKSIERYVFALGIVLFFALGLLVGALLDNWYEKRKKRKKKK